MTQRSFPFASAAHRLWRAVDKVVIRTVEAGSMTVADDPRS